MTSLKGHSHTVRRRTLNASKKTHKSICRELYRAFSLRALPYGAVRHLTAPYGNAEIEHTVFVLSIHTVCVNLRICLRFAH